MNPLVFAFVLIIVAGVLLWLARIYLTPVMDPTMMRLLHAAVVVVVVLVVLFCILSFFGLWPLTAPPMRGR
jgi:hypothetical protein